MQTPEIATVDDLVRVLDEHPQWLEALRGRLLTRELLELPQQLADFIAATDRRFTDLDQRFAELARQLAEFAANTDRRFEAADQRSTELEQRSTELERTLAEFAANTDRRFTELERQLADSIANTDRQFKQLRTDIGPIKAAHAANSARAEADLMAEKQGLTFVAFVERQELWAMVPAFEKSKIPEKELLSFRHADIVIRAAEPDGTECYVAVEASYTANGRDTKRAQRNARFLTRFTGRRADPVVAGLRIDDRIRAAVESGEIAWHELHPQTFEVE